MTVFQLTATDEIIGKLPFKPYRQAMQRQAVQFLPGADEPQIRHIQTPWGETLECKAGDYIVNEIQAPGDRWPVDREIFEESYVEVRAGYFIKRPLTHLAPLVSITSDPDQIVTVHTLEGPVAVRAGDFYLARGIKGEIWPYPKEKADANMLLATDVGT